MPEILKVAIAGNGCADEIATQKALRKIGGVFVYGRISKKDEADLLILFDGAEHSRNHQAAIEFNIPVVQESWLLRLSTDFERDSNSLSAEHIAEVTLLHTVKSKDSIQPSPPSPNEAAERILAGDGTLADIVALIPDDKFIGPADELSSILKVMRTLNVYHSVLTVRTEAVLGSYPTTHTRYYNAWLNSIMSRLQYGYPFPEVMADITSHLSSSLQNIEHDFTAASTSTTTTPTQMTANVSSSPMPMQVDDSSDILSPPRPSTGATPIHQESQFITIASPTFFPDAQSLQVELVHRRPWIKAPPSAPHSPCMTLDTPKKPYEGTLLSRSVSAVSGLDASLSPIRGEVLDTFCSSKSTAPVCPSNGVSKQQLDKKQSKSLYSQIAASSLIQPVPQLETFPTKSVINAQVVDDAKRPVKKSWGNVPDRYTKNQNSNSRAANAPYYVEKKDYFGGDAREKSSSLRENTGYQRRGRDLDNRDYQSRLESNQQPSDRELKNWRGENQSENHRPNLVEPISSVSSHSIKELKPTYASIVSKGQSESVQQVAVKPVQAWRRGEFRPTPYSSNMNSNARTSWRDRKENVEPQGQWRKDRNWRSNNK